MGELRVAAGPYPADISAVRAVGILAARYPRVAVELRIADWGRVAADTLEGRIDLGLADITEAGRDPDLETEAIRSSPLNFFCAAGHPLARRRGVVFDDLLEFPWAGPSIPGRIRAVLPQVDKAFGSFGDTADRFYPRILVETFSAAKDIVLGGQALGAAVKGQIDGDIRDGRLVTLPIDTPWLTLNYGFIAKRGRTLSPAAKAFMDIVWQIERRIPQ
jgi:DNA-binding transcriptional LysR family regulator